MAQVEQMNPQASPFIQYSYLDTLDTQRRKEIQPRKRALKDMMQSEMTAKNEKMRTEDGKNFFVLATKKAKPSLTHAFLMRAYETFQQQEHPERNLNQDEAQRFIDHLEDCRDKAAQEKTKMDHKRSRPPEAFF